MEVLVDPDGHVYFLEANADMQGGMLATEMLTGVDPVELAIELSCGAPNIDEARLESNGHAFDVRLCAEGERAAGAKVEELRFPPAPHGKVRVEPNVEVGDEVPPEPVLARIATFAPGRHDALLALDRTLAETSVGEIATNVSFLRSVLNHESFRAGQYDVRFTDRLGA
jgi:acetyl/propionyl-CoA carboxylase alpha subunit